MGSIVLKNGGGFNSRLGEEKLGCFRNYKNEGIGSSRWKESSSGSGSKGRG